MKWTARYPELVENLTFVAVLLALTFWGVQMFLDRLPADRPNAGEVGQVFDVYLVRGDARSLDARWSGSRRSLETFKASWERIQPDTVFLSDENLDAKRGWRTTRKVAGSREVVGNWAIHGGELRVTVRVVGEGSEWKIGAANLEVIGSGDPEAAPRVSPTVLKRGSRWQTVVVFGAVLVLIGIGGYVLVWRRRDWRTFWVAIVVEKGLGDVRLTPLENLCRRSFIESGGWASAKGELQENLLAMGDYHTIESVELVEKRGGTGQTWRVVTSHSGGDLILILGLEREGARWKLVDLTSTRREPDLAP